MPIKNTRLLYSKQFKTISLLEKIKSNQNLKIKQSSLIGDTVKISSKDKKILAKANFSQDDTSISYKDSIFGKAQPCMLVLRSMSRCFSSIFCKKFSIENTIEKLNSYQKLSYIKDTNEFCQKAFEQIKKDFGYKDINIPLVLDKYSTSNAGWELTNCVMHLCADTTSKLDGSKKADIIEYLIHEFIHVKQTEMSYRASLDKYLDAIAENYPRRIVGNLLAQPNETLAEIAKSTGQSLENLQKVLRSCGLRDKVDFSVSFGGKEQIFDKETAKINLDRVFGHLKPFRKGSVKYQKSLNYIEGARTYIPHSIDKDRYERGILEKEAFKSGRRWRSIVALTD